MNNEIKIVRVGLFLVMLSLIFGIGTGVVFGIAEDSIHSYISNGIASHAGVHDDNSGGIIWKYAKRAHFHATGIAAFSLGLIILVMFSSLKPKLKTATSFFIGLGGLYSLSWFTMFVLAPSIGLGAAHHHIITEMCVYVGVGGLLVGIAILCANLFLNMFHSE